MLTFDVFNFFDQIYLHPKWWKYTKHDTPIGSFLMTVAGYGHKLIMSHSQTIAVLLGRIEARITKRIWGECLAELWNDRMYAHFISSI